MHYIEFKKNECSNLRFLQKYAILQKSVIREKMHPKQISIIYIIYYEATFSGVYIYLFFLSFGRVCSFLPFL